MTMQAQNWDYEKYPKLDVELMHLDAELRILETGDIEGDILYNIGFNVSGVDSIVLDASKISVSSVFMNDSSVDFTIDQDELVIYLNETYSELDVANLRIQYMTIPEFGIHRDEYGTMWTSMLPRTTRHWLPVIDHPRVSFTTELVFTHPAGQTVVANGRQSDSEILSVDEEITSYVSNKRIPASALSWSLGDISLISGTANSSQLMEVISSDEAAQFEGRSAAQINIYATTNNLDEIELLETAVHSYQQMQESTGVNYPFDDLNIVVLDDNSWETKNYGAGTVFAYKNLGSLNAQINRGVLAQWTGVHLREEQWSDADAVSLLKAHYGNYPGDIDLIKDNQDSPYNVFGYEEFRKWQSFLDTPEMSSLRALIERSEEELFSKEILSWNDFAQIIYEKTGQTYFERFIPDEPEVIDDVTGEITYSAEMDWNESERTIQITFNAENEQVDELVTVDVEEITFLDNNRHELTFTGGSDTVTLNVSANVENVKLTIRDRDDISLTEQKPFMFWIYQLRNDDNPERRKQAAAAISRFEENPDLQLALNDILQVESNPEVYAEILRSLSLLTRGASGTHERFIEMSSSQQHPEVQKAAAEALAHYPGNERVINRLRTVISQTGDKEIRIAAINSLANVTEADRFNNLVGNIITRESVLNEVPLLLQLLAEKGDPESAVEYASTFVSREFPYQVRLDALDLLLEYDRNSASWEDRLPDLLSDRDPRIRHRATDGLQIAGTNRRQQIIQERLIEEYDERVRTSLSEFQ